MRANDVNTNLLGYTDKCVYIYIMYACRHINICIYREINTTPYIYTHTRIMHACVLYMHGPVTRRQAVGLHWQCLFIGMYNIDI